MRRSYEDKISAVRAVESGRSLRSVAKVYEMDSKTLAVYLHRAKLYGSESLREDKVRRYSLELKNEIVSRIEAGDAIGRLSSIYGIPCHTIRRWRNKHAAGGKAALEDKRKQPKGQRPHSYVGFYDSLKAKGLLQPFVEAETDKDVLKSIIAEIPLSELNDIEYVTHKINTLEHETG